MMMHPDRIEQWPLARLKPYARNAKSHDAKSHDANQVAKIAASMAEFGWTVPVLVAADGELIAGHGRILAAAHLGLTEAPVIVLGHPDRRRGTLWAAVFRDGTGPDLLRRGGEAVGDGDGEDRAPMHA